MTRESAGAEPSHALDESQVEHFIEHGFLLLRGALPAAARTLADDTLVRQDPAPGYRGRGGKMAIQALAEVDLNDASTWGGVRLDLETQRSLPIATFAPKLWGALTSLIGSEEQIRRNTMGEQFILNADFKPPSPGRDKTWRDGTYWHIDAPDHQTSLEGRRDALVLLVLWSDVEPDGGGPLVSGQSLGHVARELQATPEGVDTLADEWGAQHAQECDDVFEFHGEVGDVLITHAFALHSAQKNGSNRVRVLENPCIFVSKVLDYSWDNPSPTPVEACVIRRLAEGERRKVRGGVDERAHLLREFHADYFLPGRRAWRARVSAGEQAKVHELDRALMFEWTSRTAQRLGANDYGTVHQLKSAISLLREVFVNERDCGMRPPERLEDPDFSKTAWSRMGRGFVNSEGQNYSLACLLDQLFERAELFGLRHGDERHVFVRVTTQEGQAFADAWSPHQLFVLESLADALPGVPTLAELPTSDREARACFAADAYERAQLLRWEPPRSPSTSLEVLAEAVRADGENAGGAADGAWPTLLEARLSQLMGDSAAASRAYADVQSKLGKKGVTARVAEALGRRAAAGRLNFD